MPLKSLKSLLSSQLTSDSEAACLRPDMAITASVQPESGRIVSARSDFRHLSWFQRRPGPIWMAWSGLGQTHLAWKQAGVQESSDPNMVERNRNATSLSLSDSAAFFHRRSGSYCGKTSLDPIWFWLTVSSFGQKDPVRKQAGVLESSGPVLANASEPIRTECE